MALPHYRYGWTLFGLLAVLPALVSGNMLIHEIERLRARRAGARWQTVLWNLAVLVICVAVIGVAVRQWL